MSICPADNTTNFASEQPLWDHGQTFHTLGLEIALGFGAIASIIALMLVIFHGTHYSRPYEQKHIIRILVMIPVYAIISFFSFWFYKYAVYWQVIRDCYEAFAIASFFTLLCHYIAPTLHEQKNYFRTITPKNWFWGVFGLQMITGGQNRGPFRRPRSGLTWFNVVWIGIFQYCFVRVVCTFVALITELLGRYCEHSINPKYGHFWYQVLTAVSVTIAMFCVIQFYIQTKDDLREHKPFLKVLCIKLVIFFSFWQQLVISFLASQYGPLKPSATLNAPDIYIGIPTVLINIEMAGFAVMHIFAFSWRPYSLKNNHSVSAPGSIYDVESPKYYGGFLGLKAYLDAANPWDIIKASARGFRWLFVGYKHRTKDESYQTTGKADEYMGPVDTRPRDQATELRPGKPFHTVQEDDRTGLLHDSSGFGRAPTHTASPYQTYEQGVPAAESDFDLSNPAAYTPNKAAQNGASHYGAPAAQNNVSYHGGPAVQNNVSYYGAPAAQNDTSYHGAQAAHPAYRPEQPRPHDPRWNMFGGTQSNGRDNEYPDRI